MIPARPAGALAPLLAATLALVAAGPAAAVSPKYFLHDTASELARGEVDGVAVDADGTLRRGPAVEALAPPEETTVWDVAVDGRTGDVYLATGDDGWVLRRRDGELERFFQCAALQVLSVAVDGQGRVWAGTAPDGFVYRIGRDGTGEIALDAEERYVWDLVVDDDGDVWAGVGPEAAIWRIDGSGGDAERVARIEDRHVVALGFDGEGRLLAGTEGRGLVLRLGADGRPRVLFDAPQAEIGAVAATADGAVWAAAQASGPERETASADGSADGTGPGDGDDPIDYAFEFGPAGADEGVLYRIDPAGDAIRVWESGQDAIFDLAPDGPAGEAVLVATGGEGGLWSVAPDGGATLLLETRAALAVALARGPGDADGPLWLATSDPAGLLRVGPGLSGRGTYESEVLDAGRPAAWGRLEWDGEGDGVSLAWRAGATDEPDGTWTDWTDAGDARDASLADAGVARYLQWRLTLRGGSGDPRPLVRRVRVSALERNVAPRIASVEVVPSGLRFYEDVPELRPRPLWQALPGGVKVQYQFDNGGLQDYPPEQRAPWTRGMRQIRWDAIDPNQDFLVYTLAYRRADETRWKDFAEDVEGTNFAFHSIGVPDGTYVIRVTASDVRDNPVAPRTAARESEPFVVDNTAPVVEGLEPRRDGASVRIEGRGVDALSEIVRIEVSVDGGDWSDVPPADGIHDAPREDFATTVEAAPGEEHSILFRVTDLAGNLGTARVLLRP